MAIEERLKKFINLKQFHFRYTKEMLFDIVSSLSSWRPDLSLPDVQSIRSALEEVGRWGERNKKKKKKKGENLISWKGVPVLVEPGDIKYMGSVNERGFLMFFVLFIPALEVFGNVGDSFDFLKKLFSGQDWTKKAEAKSTASCSYRATSTSSGASSCSCP